MVAKISREKDQLSPYYLNKNILNLNFMTGFKGTTLHMGAQANYKLSPVA
jgi:hypothetical protein